MSIRKKDCAQKRTAHSRICFQLQILQYRSTPTSSYWLTDKSTNEGVIWDAPFYALTQFCTTLSYILKKITSKYHESTKIFCKNLFISIYINDLWLGFSYTVKYKIKETFKNWVTLYNIISIKLRICSMQLHYF